MSNASTEAPAPDDAALAQAAKTDAAAFTTLYRRHVQRVYRYLLARAGNAQDAQDLTAQTFLAAWQGIGGYRGHGPFPAWLMGIARRKWADHVRQTHVTLPLDAARDAPYPGPSPDVVVGRQLQMEQVAAALRMLSPDRAEALALRIFGGLSAAEAAQVLGKSEAAVKMLVHRAVQDLQQRWAVTAQETER